MLTHLKLNLNLKQEKKAKYFVHKYHEAWYYEPEIMNFKMYLELTKEKVF